MLPSLRILSRSICVAGAAVLFLPGCIPSNAPAPATAPAPSAPQPAPVPGRASLHFDTRPIEEMNAPVTMSPLPDGTGYQLSGVYNLKATLVRGATDQWVLQGTLQFPTGGFVLGEPSPIPIGDVVIQEVGDVQLRQNTTHMLLQIPIQLPAAGAVVTQGVEEVKLNATLTAPHTAEIMVLLVSG